MNDDSLRGLERIRAELQEGIGLAKCRKCGCMQEALEHLQTALPGTQLEGRSELRDLVNAWQQQMKPIQYSCLGCEYCYPAVALNALQEGDGLHLRAEGGSLASCARRVRCLV